MLPATAGHFSEDCICTLSCGAALGGAFTFEVLRVFQTSACGQLINTLAWTRKMGHVACVVGLCLHRS